MKRLLLDTQMLVWLAERPAMVPKRASELLRDDGNALFFSLVSIWEVAIKLALKRPDFTTEPKDLRDGFLRIGFTELPILPLHVFAVATLPPIHRDPFDRLLVAQAQVESLTLMTTDKKLAQYGRQIQRF